MKELAYFKFYYFKLNFIKIYLLILIIFLSKIYLIIFFKIYNFYKLQKLFWKLKVKIKILKFN